MKIPLHEVRDPIGRELAAALMGVLALSACGAGTQGSEGPQGPPGPHGPAGPVEVLDGGLLSTGPSIQWCDTYAELRGDVPN
jgi:hypothetical protein